MNSNVDRVTVIHPKPDDARIKTFREARVEISDSGNRASVKVNKMGVPSWEDVGMDVVISMDRGTVDFSGYVYKLGDKNPSMAMPIPVRVYKCKTD